MACADVVDGDCAIDLGRTVCSSGQDEDVRNQRSHFVVEGDGLQDPLAED
jgi:hypothetical protein